MRRLKTAAVRAVRAPRRARDRRRARRFYAQFVRPGSLCFDVGANVGSRTDAFLRLGARVVAVEPQPACVARLRERFGDRVRVEDVAVGPPGVERADLAVADWSTIATMSADWRERVVESRRFGGDRWRETVEVAVTTLDALIDRHGVPDFAKIDVEGFEREVLDGLSQPLPALSVEFTPEYREAAVACLDRLVALGMREFNVSFGEELAFAETWTDAETVLRRLDADWSGASGDVYARS